MTEKNQGGRDVRSTDAAQRLNPYQESVGKRGVVPKIVDWDARRDEILDATWRVIARDGLVNTTVRAIAREAGCSQGVTEALNGTHHNVVTK